MKTDRHTRSAVQLLRQAIGDRRAVSLKITRSCRTLRHMLVGDEAQRRLRTLRDHGLIDRIPTRGQLLFGAWDMLRFVIVPAARDYYLHKEINFTFHQVLRFLDDPLSIADPTGLYADFGTITGHVMQVVHLNPVYDMQLLSMWSDGLQRFEAEVAAMVDGSHPRAATIGAIVEDPSYHGKLLEYIRQYRRDPDGTEPIVRQEQSLRGDPHFANAERTFASLPGYIGWCNALPTRWSRLVVHRATLKRFPLDVGLPFAAGQP